MSTNTPALHKLLSSYGKEHHKTQIELLGVDRIACLDHLFPNLANSLWAPSDNLQYISLVGAPNMTDWKELQADLQQVISKKTSMVSPEYVPSNGIIKGPSTNGDEVVKESNGDAKEECRDLKRKRTSATTVVTGVGVGLTTGQVDSNKLDTFKSPSPSDSSVKWMEIGKSFKQTGKEKTDDGSLDLAAVYNFAACLCYMFHLSDHSNHPSVDTLHIQMQSMTEFTVKKLSNSIYKELANILSFMDGIAYRQSMKCISKQIQKRVASIDKFKTLLNAEPDVLQSIQNEKNAIGKLQESYYNAGIGEAKRFSSVSSSFYEEHVKHFENHFIPTLTLRQAALIGQACFVEYIKKMGIVEIEWNLV